MRENQHEYKDEKVAQSPKDKNKNNSYYKTLLNKNINDNNNKSNNKSKKGDNKSVTSFFKAPLPPTYSFTKSRRKLHMFLNWITCGTANTDEKSVVVINKRKGAVSSVSENNMGKFCKERKLRGVDVKSGSKNSRQEDSNNIKTSGAAYKPVNGPNCSYVQFIVSILQLHFLSFETSVLRTY